MSILKSMIQFRNSTNELFAHLLQDLLNTPLRNGFDKYFGNEKVLQEMINECIVATIKKVKPEVQMPAYSIVCQFNERTQARGIVLVFKEVETFENKMILIVFRNEQCEFYTLEESVKHSCCLIQRNGSNRIRLGTFQRILPLDAIWQILNEQWQTDMENFLTLGLYHESEEYGFVCFKENELEDGKTYMRTDFNFENEDYALYKSKNTGNMFLIKQQQGNVQTFNLCKEESIKKLKTECLNALGKE